MLGWGASAYHAAMPFGAHIAGPAAAFVTVYPDAQYDSWLTVGLTAGLRQGEIGSFGAAPVSGTAHRHPLPRLRTAAMPAQPPA